jgi:hypothetical protein
MGTKPCIAVAVACALVHAVSAQISLSNGPHSIEISGALSTYYNHRFLKPGENNRSKDRFRLRDAQLQIEGRMRNHMEYELQIDFADLTLGSLDPENPGLMDGYVQYNHHIASIRVGYGKVPYSRSSLVPFKYTPYWQRAELVRGNVFARRDIGATIIKTFYRQLITLQGGIYTGIGEPGLRGDNDPSGRPEYIARAEFAWPARYRYRDIDTRVTPKPMLALGLNGRYTNKSQPEGRFLPQGAAGEYGIKVIDGERYVLGADVTAQYKGFSAQFEIHQMQGRPQNPSSTLLAGLPADVTGGYFRAGGYYGQLNYYSEKLRTIASVRFEELDLNDLVPGNSRRFSAALAYQIDGFQSMIKAQWWSILREESIDPLRWSEQVRVGWQVQF